MLLALISLSHLASANETGGTLSLAWDRSPSTDVVGYRVYFGPASRRYTNSVYVGNATSNVVRGLTAGVPYYFAMTAVDATGLESDYSPELAHTPAIGGPQVKMTLASNRQVILRVNGSTGQVYDFLTTTNLTAWSFLGRASVASDGQAICIDYEAPSHRSRYYKALLR